MMWSFIKHAFSSGKYGSNLVVVKYQNNGLIFAVRAPNQKRFGSIEEKEKAWALLLDYAKQRPQFEKPKTSKEYTKLRQRFLSGLQKISPYDGVIRKLKKKDVEHFDKEFIYFSYEGKKIPFYHEEVPPKSKPQLPPTYHYEESASPIGEFEEDSSSSTGALPPTYQYEENPSPIGEFEEDSFSSTGALEEKLLMQEIEQMDNSPIFNDVLWSRNDFMQCDPFDPSRDPMNYF